MNGTMPMAVWMPAALALLGVVVALICDAFGRRSAAIWAITAGLAGAAAAGFAVALQGEGAIALGTFASGGGFSGLPALGYLLAACAVTSGGYASVNRDRGVAIAATVAVGAIFSHALLASLDLIVTFVALAGLTVAGYALVGATGTRRAEESAVRYLVQGAVASGLALYGLGVLFGLAGGQSGYPAVSGALADAASRPLLLAFGLVLSALAFKLGAFPFHSWVPDAYETTDDASVAFLSSTPKVAATVALLMLVRLAVFAQAVPENALSGPIMGLAVGSMAFGVFGMLRQRNVARMLGYSAIANAGYALLGVGLGESAGVAASVLLIATYAVGACGAFAALSAVRRVRQAWDGTLDGLGGLSREAPLTAATLAVFMLSLTGIPLFAGFWGKLVLLIAAVDAGEIWVAVAAGIAAVVSFASYGAVVRHAYFGPEPGDAAGSGSAPDVRDDADSGAHTDERAPSTPATEGGASAATAAVLAIALVVGGLVPLAWGIQTLYALFAIG